MALNLQITTNMNVSIIPRHLAVLLEINKKKEVNKYIVNNNNCLF